MFSIIIIMIVVFPSLLATIVIIIIGGIVSIVIIRSGIAMSDSSIFYDYPNGFKDRDWLG